MRGNCLRYAVIGAGGIGCYYAARLIQAGETVSLIARGEHLSAMQKQGLSVQHSSLEFNAPVVAYELETWFSDTKPDQVDVVIVCLKAMQTAEFAKLLSDWFQLHKICNKPVVLSLQNGVENEKQLAAVLPKNVVLGGIARRIGAHIIRPGFVESVGPAQIILGMWPNHQQLDVGLLSRVNEITRCFNNALIPTEISEDINKELWRKLIINNGVNPLCALVGIETGVATKQDDLRVLIKGAMDEAAIAAKANGVELTSSDIDEMLQLITTFDSIKPSMLIDREKGRPLEIDEICGVVIRGCEQLGFDAPYNRCISVLLRQELKNDNT